jgi:hypothetical protein
MSPNFTYLSYDERGKPRWSPCKLDAVRLNMDEIRDLKTSVRSGKSRVCTATMDGHYETYNSTTFQVFKRGRYWHGRYATVTREGENWHDFDWRERSADKAIKAAKNAIDDNL